MRTLRLLLPVVLLLLLTTVSHASSTYYLSPTGNDASNGTSPATAWRTIDRVNQISNNILPGDQILFQRGGTFRGTLNMARGGVVGNPVTVGAYGTGNQPIISGSLLATGWTVYSGNIWQTNVGGGRAIPFLFANGALMTIARYPNTGWLHNQVATNTTLYDTELSQADGYWNGASAVIRGSNWSYEVPTITAFASRTLTFGAIASFMGSDNWGFFMRNKLSELDMAGEWFYDSTSGMLYLWAPGNANPNSLTIETGSAARGVFMYYHRSYVTFTDLCFQHQIEAGIYIEDADHITVTNCTFQDLYKGISTVGNNNTYSNNLFQRTFATAIFVLDDTPTITGNTLTNIAMQPGMGEANWGYFGIRVNGNGPVVRSNHVTNTGYVGIIAEKNALIEKNVVVNATALLNDGGGIAFDKADGLTIQDNVVRDCLGNIDSSAPSSALYLLLNNGIYFGNNTIKNTTIQRNTVSGCSNSGLFVDHTMLNTGNQVKDNVCFNNHVQMTVSDFSNATGPGAVSPFVVAQFSDLYSGNTFYSVRPDQYCMWQYYTHSAANVDFGTFSNNHYFNPYSELVIHVHNTFSTYQKSFTVARWQNDRADDSGSTASPIHWNPYAATSDLSGNMVVNGTFDANITGWGGYPTNSQFTSDITHLDNGCLKSYLPNNSIYWDMSMRNPDQFTISNGQWYRMRFSIQSNAFGEVRCGVKGISQLMNALTIHERTIPFDAGRREVEFFFQSALSDQALVQFVNNYSEPMYYLDNVQLHRVAVQALDPMLTNTLLVNEQSTVQTLALPAGCWSDVSGVTTTGTVTLQPYTSKVFYKVPDGQCGVVVTSHPVSTKVNLGGALNWGASLMRDDLRVANLIPTTEPYTAMGYTLENAGATVPVAIYQATGNQAIVDWVIVELKNNDGGYTVAARRAALVCRDGTVIGPDGSTVLSFTAATQGKYLVVRHRSHLGVMTAVPMATEGLTIDFTNLSTATYGSGAQQTDGVKNALWLGNVNSDNKISYTGANNDRDPQLAAIGGVVPTTVVTGYKREDVNMDAWVIYTGAANDRDPILTVIGGTVPTNVMVEQVP